MPPAGLRDRPPESKWKFDELLTYLEGGGRKGDVTKGRAAFEKGQCLKCHKYGSEGEGLGPDLTTLSKRFKRSDTLEAMFYPSKVISDQYRSVTIVTKKGQQLNGLAALQGDTITVFGWRARDGGNWAHSREITLPGGAKMIFGPPAGTGDGGGQPAVDVQ